MRDKPQPPAGDDEARFDDEGSAIGHPEPNEAERSQQKDGDGCRDPVPKRGGFENLKRSSKPDSGS
jgi:hypothetical protein